MTLRVGYLLDRYPHLSQTFVLNEVRELRRQGVEVTVVALRPGDLPPDPEVLLLRDFVDVVPGANRRRHLWWATRHPVRYARFLLAVRGLGEDAGTAGSQVRWRHLTACADRFHEAGVEVVHAHFAWAAAGAADCVAALLGVPWSFTGHANDLLGRTRELDRKLDRADAVVTVCDYNVRELRARGVTRELELVVCGVEPPDPLVPVSPDVDVVTVGRLVEKKGVDTLVEAAALCAARGRRLRVDVVGDGPLRGLLEQLAAERGVAEDVRFLGARSHEEALGHIARGRVFALPLRIAGDGDRDSMPVVIKEAMARAVPVVASDEVAVPEMVDATCGVLVPPGDPSALADALLSLVDDDARRQALGAAGRARVLERFTICGEVAKQRALLQRLADRRHARLRRAGSST